MTVCKTEGSDLSSPARETHPSDSLFCVPHCYGWITDKWGERNHPGFQFEKTEFAVVRKARCQEHKAAGWIVSTVRKRGADRKGTRI